MRSLPDILYLAWKYLAYHRFKTALLVVTVSVVLYLTLAMRLMVDRASDQLTDRAEQTPLLLGAKGSQMALVLRALYFESDFAGDIPYASVSMIRETRLANVIPLHLKYRSGPWPIVGTSAEYLQFRQRSMNAGRSFALLGECVLGWEVAQAEGLSVGDHITSSAESILDLAGVYPLKMKVAGILRPSGTADDRAIFVDVKTVWVIAGLGHGHENVIPKSDSVASGEGAESRTLINTTVTPYHQITDENRSTFHFHGSQEDYPLTSVIVIPPDEKSNTLLQARFIERDEGMQLVIPRKAIERLLESVFAIRHYLQVAVVVGTLTTIALVSLVFALSWRLRREEMEAITKIGGSRGYQASLVIAEILFIATLVVIIAIGALMATFWIAGPAESWLIQFTS